MVHTIWYTEGGLRRLMIHIVKERSRTCGYKRLGFMQLLALPPLQILFFSRVVEIN